MQSATTNADTTSEDGSSKSAANRVSSLRRPSLSLLRTSATIAVAAALCVGALELTTQRATATSPDVPSQTALSSSGFLPTGVFANAAPAPSAVTRAAGGKDAEEPESWWSDMEFEDQRDSGDQQDASEATATHPGLHVDKAPLPQIPCGIIIPHLKVEQHPTSATAAATATASAAKPKVVPLNTMVDVKLKTSRITTEGLQILFNKHKEAGGSPSHWRVWRDSGSGKEYVAIDSVGLSSSTQQSWWKRWLGKGKVKEKRSAGNADAGTGTSKHGDGKCTPGDTEADAAAPQASPPILLKMMDGTFAMDRLEIVKTGAIHNVDGTRMGLQLGSDFLDRHQGVLDKENEELRLQSGDETFFIPLIRPRKTIGFGPSDPAPKLARDGTKPDVGDGEL